MHNYNNSGYNFNLLKTRTESHLGKWHPLMASPHGIPSFSFRKGESAMKMEITVPEVIDLINEIRQEPENLFEMIRSNVQETVGQYLLWTRK